MKINRRQLLFGSAMSLLASPRAFGRSSQTDPAARLLAALQRNRLVLTLVDTPSGPGWDWLVMEASGSRFTLIGEEHGVAETAQFSSALFAALRRAGYSQMAIELSPPIAEDAEAAARRKGRSGIEDLLKTPGLFTFYNMREEVRFLESVIAAAPKNERVLWGLDREIFSDRYMISRLEPKVPKRAQDAFERLKQASKNAWKKNEQTRNPDDMFILAEDPSLVAAVRTAWPNPDRESELILRTLEESLAIETAERGGGLWPYMERRTQWMRGNLASLVKGSSAKVMMKFGYNHMVRGANYVNVFDLGAMADELAALTGDRAFHILVLPGSTSTQAVPGDKRSFRSVSTADYDDLGAGDGRLTRVLSRADATGHEVIDLRALRPLAMRGLESWNPDVVRTIYGYDAAVIWKGAHASTGLE